MKLSAHNVHCVHTTYTVFCSILRSFTQRLEESSDTLLQSAAIRACVRADFSTFGKVLKFVPIETVIREHNKPLSSTIPPSLLIVSAAGQPGVNMCIMLLQKCGTQILLRAKDHEGKTALHTAANNEPLLSLFLTEWAAEPLLTSLSRVTTSIFMQLNCCDPGLDPVPIYK